MYISLRFTLFCLAVLNARKMFNNVMWSPSEEANLARTLLACSRWAVALIMIESADKRATMLTISSLCDIVS